jgi:hypothetical protein
MREQKAATDSLRQAWKNLNDEQNKGPEAARAVAEKDAAALRTKLAEAERALAAAQALPTTVNRGQLTGTADRTQAIQEAEAALDKARRASRAADAALAEDDARREVEATDKRIAALTRLVAAGKATAAEQQELRKAQAEARAEIAAATPQYRATADGIQRLADLQDRASSIEDAFTGKVKESTTAQKDAVAALRDRVDLTLALGEQRGFTADRIAELQAAVTQLDAVQQHANLTDAQTLALLKTRAEATRALTTATSAVLPNRNTVGLPPVPQLRAEDSGPAFPTSLLPATQPQTFGGFGDLAGGQAGSAVKGFTDAIVQGLHDAKASITAAMDESIVGPIAEKTQLLHGIGREMGDALRAGLTTVITTGIAALITGNGDVLLSALGGILTQMGEAMVSTGIAMVHLLPALSNPFTSGPALIAAGALIAGLGIALSSAATGGGSSHGTGGGGAALAPITQTFTVQPSTVPATTGARTEPASVPARPAVTNHFTVIGPSDPAAQRQIVQMVNLGMARGV